MRPLGGNSFGRGLIVHSKNRLASGLVSWRWVKIQTNPIAADAAVSPAPKYLANIEECSAVTPQTTPAKTRQVAAMQKAARAATYLGVFSPSTMAPPAIARPAMTVSTSRIKSGVGIPVPQWLKV